MLKASIIIAFKLNWPFSLGGSEGQACAQLDGRGQHGDMQIVGALRPQILLENFQQPVSPVSLEQVLHVQIVDLQLHFVLRWSWIKNKLEFWISNFR